MIVSQFFIVLISAFLFSGTGFSQTAGCVFLEGLELPCFGDGVSCECANYFTEEAMNEACLGTLSPDVAGCANTCGRACCDTRCSLWSPEEHSVCEVCSDCNGTVRGSVPLSCDDPEAVNAGKNRCGTFYYGCGSGHQIECQGTGVVQGDPGGKCFLYQIKSVPADRCALRFTGATPNICNGSPTGAPECGGFPDPCANTSGKNACLGSANECWTCSFLPGNPGKFADYCAVSNRLCVAEPPSEVNVVLSGCGYTCPGPSKPEGSLPPYDDCGTVVSECSNDGECP